MAGGENDGEGERGEQAYGCPWVRTGDVAHGRATIAFMPNFGAETERTTPDMVGTGAAQPAMLTVGVRKGPFERGSESGRGAEHIMRAGGGEAQGSGAALGWRRAGASALTPGAASGGAQGRGALS